MGQSTIAKSEIRVYTGSTAGECGRAVVLIESTRRGTYGGPAAVTTATFSITQSCDCKVLDIRAVYRYFGPVPLLH